MLLPNPTSIVVRTLLWYFSQLWQLPGVGVFLLSCKQPRSCCGQGETPWCKACSSAMQRLRCMAPCARPCAMLAAQPPARGPVQRLLLGRVHGGRGGALCARRFPGDGGRAAPRGSGAASGLPQGVAGLRGGPVLRRLPHRG